MPTFREHYTEDGFAKNVAIVSDNGSYLVTIVCIKQVGGGTELRSYVRSGHGPLRDYKHSPQLLFELTDPFWRNWAEDRVLQYIEEFPEPTPKPEVPSRYERPQVI